MADIQDTNNIPELRSPFEQPREVDADGKESPLRSMESSILLYKGGRGRVQVQVIFDANTFRLSQQRMAELFGVTVPNIVYHLKQIEDSGEIHLSDAIKKILIPSDKWSGEVMMYNLDVVIVVGYRVNSYEATQFRIFI